MTKAKGRSNQLIAKNSVFLVTRSILGLVIGLYTSRVLLAKLGIDDYGVYHVVGSVVIMFNSVHALFTNAIQRFLNFSKGDCSKQNNKVCFVLDHIGTSARKMKIFFIFRAEVVFYDYICR